ncbi:protein kinase domain-containing protein [Massilia sp. TSP1-1-2]|uniref:protein kinase domain-containing protein n=1 Tax=Massilia sp. TSP1-1-2 TaxID=2804649 RepID=UPI003CF98F1C
MVAAYRGMGMLQSDDIVTLSKGAYRLQQQLAGSAYGVVWRAAAPDGMPDVALKLINRVQMERAQPALHTRWVASAANEIAFLQSLAPWDERHIVRLLDSGAHDGLPVMALELMEGDLGQRHNATIINVLEWITQVNQALAKVHQYGWLYLDLKPANVLLTRHGAVKLADFGTNRLRSALPAYAYAGTASWQAPEQFFPDPQQRFTTDLRTDYFALGAMFFYLVTGGVPLRFCGDCGQAYREHQGGAAAVLLARPGGMGPTLHDDEAALFLQRFAAGAADHGTANDAADLGRTDATWFPGAAVKPPAAALALLRMLLAPDRNARPRHALQISRMLVAIGRQLQAPSAFTRTSTVGQHRAGSRA